ncbi:hypothetical protein [Mesorhizobium sp.]|uniref:hypothetical protein n=1 Tax=Mesorhizobium sp. TaxID=1871066 RepID=UPI003BA9AA48
MPIHKVRLANSLILFLFLAACSTSSGGDPNGPGWTKTTTSGKPVLLSEHYQVDPNCTFLAPPSVQVLSGPDHGTIKIEQAKVFPSFTADNVRYKCNSILGNGVRVYYTPNPDFKGEDQVEIRSGSTDGGTTDLTVRIAVK